MSPTILIVNRDMLAAARLERVLRHEFAPQAVYHAASLAAARALLGATPMDIIVLSPQLPDAQGYEVIEAVLEHAGLVAAALVHPAPPPGKPALDTQHLRQQWHSVQRLRTQLATLGEAANA